MCFFRKCVYKRRKRWTKMFWGLLRQTRETLQAGKNAGFSSHNEGLADFSFPSLTSLSQTSTSLPVCQEVLFCFVLLWPNSRGPPPPREAPAKGGKGQFFCVFAWVVSNRCIFNPMLRVTWLSFSGNSLVRRMRLSSLSLMWTLWSFFSFFLLTTSPTRPRLETGVK